MKKELKVFLPQGWNNYANWIPNVRIVKNLAEADLVLFEGGEDVDPSFYGENKHRTTGSSIDRDTYEKSIYDKAIELKIPCLGVCRGSQFLCVMNKGILVQHQDNPKYIHPIHLYNGKVIDITSTHHQAAYPFRLPKDEYKVLGWTNNISKFHKGGNDEELAPEVECEIVFYPKTNSLGIQGHPEMMDYNNPTNEYLRTLLSKFLDNTLEKEVEVVIEEQLIK